jgi:hypothetical protein
MTDTFNSIQVINSITNNLNDEKRDLNSPFTFLEFLNYANILTKEQSELILYRKYLKQWENQTNIKLASINSDIREQFITFLSDIRLKFSSKEEQRFFNNIDLSNDEQLTIAVPFFASKIKEISLYFANKRNEIPKSLEYIKTKGSPRGVESFIKDQFINLYTGDDIIPGLTAPSDLISFFKNIEIEIENQYDTFNDYYDLDPTKPFSFYDTISGNRFDYFTSNTNTISSNYFLDTEKAINDIINEQKINIKEIPGLVATVETSDLAFLKPNNFINYNNTGDRNDLKYLLDIELVENYMGADMYYLSSNNAGEYTYDKLFSATSPYRNILNINNPTSSSIPGNNFKNEREIGLFYTPSKSGILRMESDFISTLIPEKIKPNTTYIFPDPVKYGKVSGLAGESRDNPLIFSFLNTEFKNNSSSFGKSLVKSDSNSQNFYAYSSREQQNFKYNNIEPLKEIEMLSQEGYIQKEVGDIFGNRFFLFNKTNYPNKQLFNFNKIQSSLGLSNTQLLSVPVDDNKETIKAIQNKPKPVLIYNPINDSILPIEIEFKEIFNRFESNDELHKELQAGKFVDLDIFKDVLFIRTEKYLVIDSFEYDGDGRFTPAGAIPRIKKLNKNIAVDQAQAQISNISNPTRVGDSIFYIKVENQPDPELINARNFPLDIYRYDINTKVETETVTNNTQLLSYPDRLFKFDVESNIVQITNVQLNYNSKQNVLYCLTNFADLNNVNFLHVFIFKIKGNEYIIQENSVIRPKNFNTTINFYGTKILEDNFLRQTILTSPEQNRTNGTFTF